MINNYLSGRIDLSQDMTVVKTNFVIFLRFLPVVLFPKLFLARKGKGFVKQRFSYHI